MKKTITFSYCFKVLQAVSHRDENEVVEAVIRHL